VIRAAGSRVEVAGLEREGGGGAVESRGPIQLEGLPRCQSLFASELHEAACIPRRVEHLLGHDASRLMLAVAVARGAGPDGDDHLWPEPTHDTHRILENGIRQPELLGLLQRARVTEIECPGEELSGSVHLAGRDQLL
jgi:hypothetical protein